MLRHECKIEEQLIVGQRPNPINAKWSEWTLVACPRCRALQEWQHHSEEQMHGGDLMITALPTDDYVMHQYGLASNDVDLILQGKKLVRRYDRYSGQYEECHV
jgi:hypothetical protein